MAIQVITPETEIKQGQWVVGESNLKYGLCSPPRQVSSVSGARINTVPKEGFSGKPEGHFLLRRNALYLCDTLQEGEALAKMSFDSHLQVSRTIDEITDTNRARMLEFIVNSK